MTTVGEMRRRTWAAWEPLWDAIGLPDDAPLETLRARWTPEVAIEIARLDGRGPRVGAVHSIDCMLGTAVLRGADLRGVDARGAYLDQVWAEGACFDDANLRGASLRQARLDGASFSDADVGGANLYQASLRDAWCIETNFDGTNLAFTNVEGANFEFTTVSLDGTCGQPMSPPWAP